MRNTLKKLSIYPPIMMLSMYSAVLSYLIPQIKEMFSMTYAQVSVISTMQSVGGLLAQVVCFGVFSALNKSRIILFSLIGAAVCLVLIGFNRVVFIMYALFLIRAFFGLSANSLSNAMVVDIFPKRTEFFVGLYHALAAGAAIVGPYLALALGNDFTLSFAASGAIIAASAVVYWFGMKDERAKPLVANRANFGGIGKLIRIFKRKNMVLYLLISFFSGFVFHITILFMSSYTSEISGLASDGAFALSMLLAGIFVGSLLYSFVAHRISTLKIIIVSNIIALGLFIVMVFVGSPLMIGIFAALGGLFIGPVMPGLFVQVVKVVPDDTGTGSAVLLFGMLLAGVLAPPIIGAIADAVGMRMAILVSLVTFVPVIALAVVLYKRSRNAVSA
ncbi:MAG: MFS transporter [Clostridia bacterium]|jgi:fucose permease|nr:MFS transporter [Clostridia bacterium]